MSEPQNGRIGGGVLKDNLLRQGVDLAFDTNLLYLKVSPEIQGNIGSPEFDDGDPNYDSGNRGIISQGIGINTNAPGHALTIAGTLGSTNLQSTYVNFDRYSIATNQISLTNQDINLTAANDIFATAISTDDLKIDFNTISTTTTDTNIELRPNVSPGAPVHTLDNPNAYGADANDYFGGSVAISGNYAIVSAYYEDDADGQLSGKAYIFNVTTGALLHTLDNPNAYDTSVTDFFGYSVAISNNYAIVSATNEDELDYQSSGKVYIFNVSTGTLVHTLDNPNAYGTSYNDRFGHSVAISGDRAIVGTYQEDDVGVNNSGKAYIFNVTTGALLHTLDNPNAYGTNAEDYFGERVAISGNYAVVGARWEDDASGNQSGKAYIFDVSTGNLVHTLDNPNAYGTSSGDFFGVSVAIDSNYVIVGASSEDDAGNNSGKAYIFNVSTGALLHTLDNPNAYGTTQFDSFGESVAISGTTAIVGAYIEDDAGGDNSGKAYIFNVTTGALLHTLDNPNAYGTSSGDQFSLSVAISGDYVIAGAQTEDGPGGNTSGKAYIFRTESVVGKVNINSDLNITGSLHATGNIQTTGDFTFGSGDEDNVTFASDINSDIIPDQTATSDLGSVSKQWLNLYSTLLNGQAVFIDELVVGDGDSSLARRQGNTFYVSTLGSNSNVGDHQHGAFRTLKHALTQVDGSTAGPTVIHIFPGEYEEEFPLTVPSHVDIVGEDIRNVIIKPTAATQNNSAFFMEDDVTIENLTIKDFYNGYAFQFTAGGLVNTRSPYIRNVTVITKGSVTSAADPRGFAQGDAGKGALIDGATLDSASLEASMLFHSVTFITPGVDCITMTNGVRVEWLNSFTYFANRGLYATQGSTGKLMPDASTRYGAEVRAIGSACVYGNFGAVADGANTLMYLISQNFAYIGTGSDVSNDNTLTVPSQEVTELNSGSIVFTSTDQKGKFSVGDNFFVDFDTGETSIDANSIDFSGIGNITVDNGVEKTFIDGERVDTGNIRFTGNTVTTLDGDLNLSPQTELFNTDNNTGLILSRGTTLQQNNEPADIRFNTDTNLFEGYSSGNLSFGGVYSSDRQDSVDAHDTNNTIVLTAGGVQVGSIDSNSTNLHGLSTGDVLFDNNLVTTTLSNSDLELRRTTAANVVDVFDIEIKENNFSNSSNNLLTLRTTDRGYVKFSGATGLVVPYGNNSTRNPTPVTGETRYNTDRDILETYNETGGEDELGAWQRAAGEGAEVTDVILKELVDLYTIVLG
jgi:hypothetical protein